MFAKDAKDRGVDLGEGHSVTLNPRGGAAFVSPVGVVVVDAAGLVVRKVSRGGVVGRPAFHSSGNMVVAEFVGEMESELIRFPVNGRGPEQVVSVLNKGTGVAKPVFELSGNQILFRLGSSWMSLAMRDSSTTSLDTKSLMGGLPKGSVVTEIRPSPMAPAVAAVAVEVAGTAPVKMVMVWNRSTGVVARVSPIRSEASVPDWSRDGRQVLFQNRDTKSGRVGLVAAPPNGGSPVEIAVVQEASR